MNSSTTSDIGLIATCPHRRLARGLEEAEAAEEVGTRLSFLRPDPSLDLTVEALEAETRRFAIGVPWHPEGREDAGLIETLVNEGRRYREVRPR